MAGRPKGLPKTGGRKAGQPNKISTNLKDAILQAAEQAGGKDGIVGYLKQQAQKNPGPFMSLLGKIMPSQVDVTVKTADLSDDEIDARINALAAQIAAHSAPDAAKLH
jgi:hypothetical protein